MNAERIMLGLLALMLGLLVWLGFAWGQEEAAWERECKAQGGRVVEDTDITTGIGSGSNGQPVVVVGTETDKFCLDRNGGIISVR